MKPDRVAREKRGVADSGGRPQSRPLGRAFRDKLRTATLGGWEKLRTGGALRCEGGIAQNPEPPRPEAGVCRVRVGRRLARGGSVAGEAAERSKDSAGPRRTRDPKQPRLDCVSVCLRRASGEMRRVSRENRRDCGKCGESRGSQCRGSAGRWGRRGFDGTGCARKRFSAGLAVGSAHVCPARAEVSDGGERGRHRIGNSRTLGAGPLHRRPGGRAASGGSVDEPGRMRDYERQWGGGVGLAERTASGRADGKGVSRTEQVRGN